MLGKRVYGCKHLLSPGEYMKNEDGSWWFCTPNNIHGQLAQLNPPWQIMEHPDDTITVHPSILCRGAEGYQWHGYLIRGEWKEC